MARLLGTPIPQYFNNNNGFLSGGSLYTYAAGTTTPKNTYSTFADAGAGTNPNPNPITLNDRGEAVSSGGATIMVILSGSYKLVLKDSSGNTIWTADNITDGTNQLLDTNGAVALGTTAVSNAVNYVNVTDASTGNSPQINGAGTDTNVGLIVAGQGTGNLTLGQSGATAIKLAGDQAITDSAGNNYIKFSKTTSAVNNIQIANAATGTGPIISAVGTDANIDVELQAKGSGGYDLLGTSSAAAAVKLYENTSNGTNYVALQSPATLSGNTTWILPSADSAGFLESNGSGTLSLNPAAVKADQTTATSTVKPVVPAVQQNHPSAAKAWSKVTVSAGTGTSTVGYNISSITSVGTGAYTLNFTTAFTTSDFVFAGNAVRVSGNANNALYLNMVRSVAPTTSSIEIAISDNTPAALDPAWFSVVVFGTQ
jgi:hypothetical protein